MADRMVEWQTEMATYILFTVHTDDDDTLIFYRLVWATLKTIASSAIVDL